MGEREKKTNAQPHDDASRPSPPPPLLHLDERVHGATERGKTHRLAGAANSGTNPGAQARKTPATSTTGSSHAVEGSESWSTLPSVQRNVSQVPLAPVGTKWPALQGVHGVAALRS